MTALIDVMFPLGGLTRAGAGAGAAAVVEFRR